MGRGRATHCRAVRAWLFVGLSAFAVPACQHYESGEAGDGAQARHGVAAPLPVAVRVGPLPA